MNQAPRSFAARGERPCVGRPSHKSRQNIEHRASDTVFRRLGRTAVRWSPILVVPQLPPTYNISPNLLSHTHWIPQRQSTIRHFSHRRQPTSRNTSAERTAFRPKRREALARMEPSMEDRATLPDPEHRSGVQVFLNHDRIISSISRESGRAPLPVEQTGTCHSGVSSRCAARRLEDTVNSEEFCLTARRHHGASSIVL